MPQWLGVVTVAVLYNVLVIVGRTVFWELQNLAPRVWFALDYICDSIYLLDMAIKAHESEWLQQEAFRKGDTCSIIAHLGHEEHYFFIVSILQLQYANREARGLTSEPSEPLCTESASQITYDDGMKTSYDIHAVFILPKFVSGKLHLVPHKH